MSFLRNFYGAGLALLVAAAPLRAQTLNPVYSFAIPPLWPGSEVQLGLTTDGTQLFLFTTRTWYTSPFDVGGSMAFTPQSPVIFSDLLITLGAQSLVFMSPSDPTRAYLTGGAGFADNRLYTLSLLPPYTDSSSVALSGLGGKPAGLAVADGGEVFLSSPTVGAGIYRLPDADTGTPDLNFGNSGPGALNTPNALAFGPDGLLYVLDTGDGRVVSFDSDGVYQSAFSLVNPAVTSALAIDPAGHLYTMNSNGGGDIYDIQTGDHLGTLADTGDVGFSGTGKASLMYADGYLYSISGTGENVYVYAVPEPGTFGLVALGLAGLAAGIRRRRR